MLDTTPQERMALTVIAVLLVVGAWARHFAGAAEAGQWLEYTAEGADTLDPAMSSVLRQRAEGELALDRLRTRPLEPGERIDPNSAPAEELDRLPRVGAALAERIVTYRVANGPFRSIDDLGAVSGIGPALLEGIGPHLALPRQSPVAGRAGGTGNQIDLNRATLEELQALSGS
jgi:competence ComEA-like helix-hairpin-helix protein